jgi:hypothetical protein
MKCSTRLYTGVVHFEVEFTHFCKNRKKTLSVPIIPEDYGARKMI